MMKLLFFVIAITFVVVTSSFYIDSAFAHHVPKGTEYYDMVTKQTDEAVSSSTIPQPDDDLSIFLYNDGQTPKPYYFELTLFADQDPVGYSGIKYNFDAPTGAVVRLGDQLWQSNSMGATIDGLADNFDLVTGTTERASKIHGSVVLDGANSGFLTFQWSQAVSDPEDVRVLKGSSLVVWKGGSGVAVWDDTVLSTVYKNPDSGMYQNVDANTSYLYKLIMEGIETGGNAEIKYKFLVPSGTSMQYQDGTWDLDSAGQTIDAETEQFPTLDGTRRTHEVYGRINTAGTAGTVDYQFAQQVDIGVTTLQQGSVFMASSDGTYTKVKQVDETVTNSAVYQKDDELLITLKANKVYSFEYFSFGNATGNGALMKQKFYAPSDAVVRVHNGLVASNALGETEDGKTFDIFTSYDTNERTSTSYGKVEMGATGGVFGVEWTQQSADVDDLSLLKGSTLIIHEFEPTVSSSVPINPEEIVVIKLEDEFRPVVVNGYVVDSSDEDSELKVWLEANKIYSFESRIFGESIGGTSFGAGMTWDWAVPEGAIVQGHFGDSSDWSAHYHKYAFGNNIPFTFPMDTYAGFDADEPSSIEHNGKVEMGDNAGYLVFRWIPQNDNVGLEGFKVSRGSSLRVLSEDSGAIKLTDQTIIDHWEDPYPDETMKVNLEANKIYTFEGRYFVSKGHINNDPQYDYTLPFDAVLYGHIGCASSSDWSFHNLKNLGTNLDTGFCFPEYSDGENNIDRSRVLQHTGLVQMGATSGTLNFNWNSQQSFSEYQTYHNGTSMRVYTDDGDKIKVKQTDTSKSFVDRGDGEPLLTNDSDLVVALEPSKLYTYEARIYVKESDGNNDRFAYSWAVPTGATLVQSSALASSSDWSSHNGKRVQLLNDPDCPECYFPDNNLSGFSINDEGMIELHGVVDMANAENGGDMEFLWSVNANAGGTTELMAGSSLRIYEAFEKDDTGTPSADPPDPTCDESIDSDFDFVPDCSDLCPNEMENINFIEDEDGCPDDFEPILFSDHLFQAFGNTITSTPNSLIDNQAILIQWNNPDDIIAESVVVSDSPFDFTFERLPIVKTGSGLPLSQNNIIYQVDIPNACGTVVNNDCVQLFRYEIPTTVYGIINGTTVADDTFIIIDLSDDDFDPNLLLLFLLLLIPLIGVLFRRKKKKKNHRISSKGALR